MHIDTPVSPPAARSPYYLATTAIEEFWDPSRSLVFLGGWCRRFSRRAFWEPLAGEVMESPWRERKDLVAAYRYVSDTYEEVLPVLGETLNDLHGVRHGGRYWRILLGPWLLYFMPVVYDRLAHLSRALERYPGIETTGLADENFVTPGDTIESVLLACEDAYNLQLCTQILAFLGRDVPRKPWSVAADPETPRTSANASERRWTLLKDVWNGMAGMFRGGRPVVLRNSYFSRRIEFNLAARTRGMVRPDYRRASGVASSSVSPDRQMRATLRSSLPKGDQLVSLLNWLLPSAMPVCFLEAFRGLEDQSRRRYTSSPTAVFSANSCYFDEVFKQWIAACTARGTMLAGTQHGGNYGSMAYMPYEDHETAIADRYYSWGWGRHGCHATVIPMPASKLAGRRVLGPEANAEGCLFVATAMPRYLISLPINPSDFGDYLAWQFRFVDSLRPEVRDALRVRPHYADAGWDIRERWGQRYPTVAMETWDIPFQRSLRNCRLYVCDHLSTTFAESLAVDKPTILFWDPRCNELRSEAQPYYDRLRAAGILHDTPEQAAEAVSARYAAVENWWRGADCQDARRQFCERFARTSPSAAREWAREFKKIAQIAREDDCGFRAPVQLAGLRENPAASHLRGPREGPGHG